MIANEEPCIADSLWTATANATPDCPPLQGTAETEVAVVGGGYTGLSAALHLAEAGVPVTLLEAETPGWGASGRNGGQVNPGLKEDPDTILAQFGPDMGQRMIQLSGGAPDLVFGLIARHRIDCAAERPGWVATAPGPAARRGFETRVAQWAKRGVELKLLSAQETAETLGTEAYPFALLDPRGGTVHPLNYALGLAAAAQSAGTVLHGHSQVTGLAREGTSYLLTTAQGRLRARRVLLCTNGYTDDLAPPLRRTVVPVRSVQVATAPLSDNLRGSILPGRHAVSDGRRLVLYYRVDPEGRFIMGGRGSYGQRGTLSRQDALRTVTKTLFPQLAGVDWQHSWGGFVAMTPDHYPHLHQLEPGVMAALGYNGRGVAMATAMGRVLADWAAGTPAEGLDFPVTVARPIPLHALRKPAVTAAIAWYGLSDRMGLG